MYNEVTKKAIYKWRQANIEVYREVMKNGNKKHYELHKLEISRKNNERIRYKKSISYEWEAKKFRKLCYLSKN